MFFSKMGPSLLIISSYLRQVLQLYKGISHDAHANAVGIRRVDNHIKGNSGIDVQHLADFSAGAHCLRAGESGVDLQGNIGLKQRTAHSNSNEGLKQTTGAKNWHDERKSFGANAGGTCFSWSESSFILSTSSSSRQLREQRVTLGFTAKQHAKGLRECDAHMPWSMLPLAFI